MIPDLRETIGLLDKRGELVTINRRIDLNDVGKVLMKAYTDPKRPAILMNKPGDCDVPLICNLYTGRDRVAMFLGTTIDKLPRRFNEGAKKRVKPSIVRSAPSQEVVNTDNIDLMKLPFPKYTQLDGGRYITSAITISKDPDTNVYDIGIYRHMLLGKNRTAFHAQPFHRLSWNMAKAMAKKKKFEAALVLGFEPALGSISQLPPIPSNMDDYELAGGIYGEPLKLVKAKTINLLVPARAEMILELEINYDKLEVEGPIAEYIGFMNPAYPKMTTTVKVITSRKKPILEALMMTKPSIANEGILMSQVPLEFRLLEDVKSRYPTIKDLTCPVAGGAATSVVFSIKQRYAGEAKQAMLYLLGIFQNLKYVIAVDDDIDVHDWNDVMWSVHFRVKADRDIIMIPNMPRTANDPSGHEGTIESILDTKTAVCIDATTPVGIEYPQVDHIDGWENFSIPEIDNMEQ